MTLAAEPLMMSVTLPHNAAAAAAVAAAAAMAAATATSQNNHVISQNLPNSTNNSKSSKLGFSIDSIVGNSQESSKLRDSLNMSPTDLSLSAAAKRFKSDHHSTRYDCTTEVEYIKRRWRVISVSKTSEGYMSGS